MADNRYVAQKDIRRNQEADQLAEFLGAISKQRQAATIESNQRQADIEAAKQLADQYPDRGAHVGQAGITPKPRDEDNLRVLLGAKDKMMDNSRLEAKALQDEYNRLQGGTREKSKALDEIDTLLKNPSQASWGQISTALSRASGEKGALAEGDVKRALPTTLRSTAAGLVNFIIPGMMNPYDDTQKGEIQKLVHEKQGLYNQELARSGAELKQRAPSLAPSLAASGTLPKVMNSLGTAAVQRGPSKADQILQRIQELEAKRSKAGVK